MTISSAKRPCCKPETPSCLRCGCRVCGNKDGRYKCRPTRCGAALNLDGTALAWPGYSPEGLRAVEPTTAEARVAVLSGLVRDALSKGAERRCPWCWVVANKGKHAPDCRAIAALNALGIR